MSVESEVLRVSSVRSGSGIVSLEGMAKVLLGLGVGLLVLGAVLFLVAKLGWTRLPGDLVYRGKNVTVYLPVGLIDLDERCRQPWSSTSCPADNRIRETLIADCRFFFSGPPCSGARCSR